MVRGRGGSERGSVAITVALSMTLLLAFAALVVDVGLSWAARTSAQTAADSAALAGATRLLAEGPSAAVLTVRDYLNANVSGLVSPPTDLAWVDNGDEGDGEIVCWTLPADPPDPGLAPGCPEGSNALQVITPPIEVDYAFAPVLGRSSNRIKALAAAGAGPAAPNNCVLCVLEPTGAFAMNVLGGGGEVVVDGGGIAVNSESATALALSAGGDISADQIRVVGGFTPPTGVGDYLPPPEPGGPPVDDPLAGLLTPDQLTAPSTPQVPPPLSGTVVLPPGVYPSITVDSGVTVVLQDGVYVFTQAAGLTITNGGRVESGPGDGATIYLACADYPTPCASAGARFRLEDGGEFAVDPPADGEYAGLSIFADRGNTRPMRVFDDLSLGGALYGPSTRLLLTSAGDVQVDSLLVVDTLRVADTGLGVSYDPSVPLPGAGRPVLIR
jgi:hypothetical protein